MAKQYRNCVGIVVFNQNKKVLLCVRKDSSGSHKSWQFPQGGVEKGESITAAALRELFEETSIKSVKFVAKNPIPLTYNFPEGVKKHWDKSKVAYDGQTMHWILLYFYGKDEEINLKTPIPEFKEWAWEDIKEAPKKIVFFKRLVYAKAVKAFKPIIEEYIEESIEKCAE